MKTGIAIIFLCIVLANTLHTSIVPGAKSAKKPLPRKKPSCCQLSTVQLDNVRLTKLCQTSDATLIYMYLENDANACSYLDKISMIDDKGKSYKPIDLHGIASCPKTGLIRSGTLFSWEFEKLDKGAESIDLEEDANAPSPQATWNWWKWGNVTVSHCKL